MLIHLVLPGITHDVVVWPQEPVGVMLTRVLTLLGEEEWIDSEQNWRVLWRPNHINHDHLIGALKGAGESKLITSGTRLQPCYNRLLREVFMENNGPEWANNENWDSNKPIEMWDGVTIEGNSDFGLHLKHGLENLNSFNNLIMVTLTPY